MALFDFINKKQVAKTKKPETIEIDGYIIDKNSGELLEAPVGREIYNIPDEVTKISLNARNNMKNSCKKLLFSDNSLLKKTSKIPGDNFLTEFDNIIEVRLPNGVEKIDYFFDAFNTKNKINFEFPSNLKEIGCNQFPPHWEELNIPNVSIINGGIVSHNTSLKSITIPQTIKELQSLSINQVKNLKTIRFNEGILKMHPQAVKGCNNLTEIYIPESLKEFYLAEDAIRLKNNFNEYSPDKEQKKEQERILNLYKTINGNTYHFIVARNQFSKMAITDNKIVFNDEFSVDIDLLSQAVYVDINNKTINNLKLNQNNINSSYINANKYAEQLKILEQEKQSAILNRNVIIYIEKELETVQAELDFMLARFKFGDESITQEEMLNKRIEIENIKMKLNTCKWNMKLISSEEYKNTDELIEETLFELEKKLNNYTNNTVKHI